MNVSKTIEVELTSEDIEAILVNYVCSRMKAQGYKFQYTKKPDSITDITFVGFQVVDKSEFENRSLSTGSE